MSFLNLTISDCHFIVGRGMVLIVSLKQNGYTSEMYISEKDFPISIGDTLKFSGKTYKIILNGIVETIGLLVKKGFVVQREFLKPCDYINT